MSCTVLFVLLFIWVFYNISSTCFKHKLRLMNYGYRIDRCTKMQMSERIASINLQASIVSFVMPYVYLAIVAQS